MEFSWMPDKLWRSLKLHGLGVSRDGLLGPSAVSDRRQAPGAAVTGRPPPHESPPIGWRRPISTAPPGGRWAQRWASGRPQQPMGGPDRDPAAGNGHRLSSKIIQSPLRSLLP